jgi:hypothetical protein
MKIPNFFIVGAPRCGTTALSEYLRHHPNVFFSDPKELGYFDEETRSIVNEVHVLSELNDYLEYFREAKDNHVAVGEGTVHYLRSGSAIPNILDFNPEARLIAIVRSPVDLVYSLHRELVLGDVEDVLDFEEAWRKQKERRNGHSIPRFCMDRSELLYSEVAMLGKQLEGVFSIAPAEQVKVIIFDDFVHSPQEIYGEVLSFLDLPDDRRTAFPQINSSNRAVRVHLFHRQLSHLKSKVARTKRALGIRRGLGVLKWLAEKNTKRQPRPPLSASFEAELRDFFREDIELLSQLIDRDLSPWLRGERLTEGVPKSRQ